MVNILIFLLSLYQLNSLTLSEIVDPPQISLNSLDNDGSHKSLNPSTHHGGTSDGTDDPVPILRSIDDGAEIDFEEPISSINIDYSRNAIILQFRKQRQKEMEMEAKRMAALNKNFMRFGRGDKSLMRFGKRQIETYKDPAPMDSDKPNERFERSNGDGARDSRGDNFMRFGRSGNLMRFGRAGGNLMRFGRASNDFMRFGRNQNLMRFGRSNSMMRFGRSNGMMRFGRSDTADPFTRLSRPDSFMRFGRSGEPGNFMRFGKLDNNFMRFGKRQKDDANHTDIESNEVKDLFKAHEPDTSFEYDEQNIEK